MDDEEFYQAAMDGVDISINVPKRKISVAGREFPFRLSDIEYQLTINRGITESYRKYGRAIWSEMTKGSGETKHHQQRQNGSGEVQVADKRMQW